MPAKKRATIYLNPRIYRALKVKSATTDRPVSDLIDEAVTLALREDEMDLAAAEDRANEPSRRFSEVLRDLKRDGLL